MTPLLIGAIVAMLTSFAVVGALASRRLRHLFLDRPGHRSLHTLPTPRSGGIGIVVGTAAGVVAGSTSTVPWLGALAAGWGFVIVVSLLDDWRDLPAWVRLPCHLAACALVATIVLRDASVVTIIGVTLAMGWLANLFNFMDGSDGLAGGMAAFGFGAYAAAATLAGEHELAVVAAAAATAAIGFLIFNFPPARIFMGDAGSIPLGFLAGALGVAGCARQAWSVWFPLVVFAPFLVDASLTLGKRALRGERIWEAHREHAYQKLNLLGLGHRRTALAYYAAMAACAAVALIWFRPADRTVLAGAGLGIAMALGVAHVLVSRAWRAHAR